MARKQRKNKEYFWGILLFTVIISLGAIAFLVSPGETPTSFIESSLAQKIASLPVIIREQTAQVIDALFDLSIAIPDSSKTLSAGERLTVSVDLLDIQSSGPVDVRLNYVVSNEKGDIVFIEHEERTIETQSSFLKELLLPVLPIGKYKLYVELLYSDTSAAARDEFRII